ncbi:MAG: metallophosphoesterase [Candidatus Omnitrophica bacterium]|nr:metallophosphoesterase [Candidatus Omnitrophota bacterium]
MRTFVIGDIHGAYQAFLQCLKKADFNKNKDHLICLGDVCDRGPHVKECIDELLSIQKRTYLLGNHDAWALDWAIKGISVREWLEQGGSDTIASYKDGGMPVEHIRLLAQAPLWLLDKNRLFLHAGFDVDNGLEGTPKNVILWDRELLCRAKLLHQSCPEFKFGGYDEIFVGHTPTLIFNKDTPQKFCNVWAIDTGAVWSGKLTIMDVDTKEYWQSTPAAL